MLKLTVVCVCVCVCVCAAFNSPKVQGKKTALEKMGEVVDMMRKGGSGSDAGRQLAAIKVMIKLLEEEGPQEKRTLCDSAQAIRYAHTHTQTHIHTHTHTHTHTHLTCAKEKPIN